MRMPCHSTGREGFALLAVLWVVTGLSVLGLAASLTARDAVRAAQNRSEYLRSLWRAEGCVELARAALDRRIIGNGRVDRARWSSAHEAFSAEGMHGRLECELHARAHGIRLDLDTVDRQGLLGFLAAEGISGPRADSLVDALADWRDRDRVPRALGAESDWYRARGRPPPRNGPLRAPDELVLVRGWELVAGLDSLVGVDEGPVPINHAPVAVLAALPGLTLQAARFIVRQRGPEPPIGDLRSLPEVLPHPSGDSLAGRFAEFGRAALTEPRAWVLTATAGEGALSVTVEARVGRSESHVVVLRRRRWIR